MYNTYIIGVNLKANENSDQKISCWLQSFILCIESKDFKRNKFFNYICLVKTRIKFFQGRDKDYALLSINTLCIKIVYVI